MVSTLPVTDLHISLEESMVVLRKLKRSRSDPVTVRYEPKSTVQERPCNGRSRTQNGHAVTLVKDSPATVTQ